MPYEEIVKIAMEMLKGLTENQDQEWALQDAIRLEKVSGEDAEGYLQRLLHHGYASSHGLPFLLVAPRVALEETARVLELFKDGIEREKNRRW